jgi:hypothetical protein
MPLLTDNSLDKNNSFLKFKYPQDSRFRLRTTHWKISDKDLTDTGPSKANINLEHKFGNVKKNEAINNNNTPSNSMDYEKQFRSQNSHSSGSQRLSCTLTAKKIVVTHLVALSFYLMFH